MEIIYLSRNLFMKGQNSLSLKLFLQNYSLLIPKFPSTSSSLLFAVFDEE